MVPAAKEFEEDFMADRSATSLMRVLDLAEGIIANAHSSGVAHGSRLESAIVLLLSRPSKVHLAGDVPSS